uniref:Uncharacterized protein n=1 Tax=Cannabis sativa TaxID=3483 RepID=A0A803P4C8_CANSA
MLILTLPNSKSKFKTGKKCYYCNKEGHFRDECRALKAKTDREKSKNRGEVDIVSDGYESARVLVVSKEGGSDEWILDLGCSLHMCPKKEMFKELKEISGGTVLLGNNKACNVLGTSSVMIKMFDGTTRTQEEVRSAAPAVAGQNDDTRLWHLRLGHVSESGISELDKQGLLKGKLDRKLPFCEECVFGKSYKVKFTTDLAFQTFIAWKKLSENQTSRKIKKLKTHNGSEFSSDMFASFYRNEDIARHHTVVKNPQQNGLAERMNRTLLERVRCMLIGAGLAKHFCCEALKTACYLINRYPSTALNFKLLKNSGLAKLQAMSIAKYLVSLLMHTSSKTSCNQGLLNVYFWLL